MATPLRTGETMVLTAHAHAGSSCTCLDAHASLTCDYIPFAGLTPQQVPALTVLQMKAELAHRGCSCAGRRQTLLTRLTLYLENKDGTHSQEAGKVGGRNEAEEGEMMGEEMEAEAVEKEGLGGRVDMRMEEEEDEEEKEEEEQEERERENEREEGTPSWTNAHIKKLWKGFGLW